MEQLSLLPEIDTNKTWERVERALEDCLLYERIGYHPEHEPKTTPGYSELPPSTTNAFHSNTEDCAIRNADTEHLRSKHVWNVRRAVRRLSKREREIIEKRYLEDPDMTDYETYNELGYSESTYYRIKHRAFYVLAFGLRLEVLKEE